MTQLLGEADVADEPCASCGCRRRSIHGRPPRTDAEDRDLWRELVHREDERTNALKLRVRELEAQVWLARLVILSMRIPPPFRWSVQ